MTDSRRLAVLAALAAFMMSSAPTPAAPFKIPCENAQDCPVGDRCAKKKSTNRTGFCVGTGSAKKATQPTNTPTNPPSHSY